MSEVLFYHLERARMEDVLPQLLAKSIERGWRAVVQTVSDERVAEISHRLWLWEGDAFLAHGSQADGFADMQPVWLTSADDNPNGSNVRILVDGADFEDTSSLDRLVIMFDGNDEQATALARQKWKSVTGAGLTATYWQQDERGAWVKKTQANASRPAGAEGGKDER